MISKKIKPNHISDIIHNMDEYLAEMRKMSTEEANEFIEFLEQYIHAYFVGHDADDIVLKKLIVEFTDAIYLKIAHFDQRDIHTNGYFGIVINRIFWEFSRKDIFAFFIIDNSLRDDRFKMTVELFKVSNFVSICPYNVGVLEYSDNYSVLPSLDYKAVEKQIDDGKTDKKHILYIEKDDSVNYLNQVLALAEEFQPKYLCIFRNNAPDDNSAATCLMGSFSDILNKD